MFVVDACLCCSLQAAQKSLVVLTSWRPTSLHIPVQSRTDVRCVDACLLAGSTCVSMSECMRRIFGCTVNAASKVLHSKVHWRSIAVLVSHHQRRAKDCVLGDGKSVGHTRLRRCLQSSPTQSLLKWRRHVADTFSFCALIHLRLERSHPSPCKSRCYPSTPITFSLNLLLIN